MAILSRSARPFISWKSVLELCSNFGANGGQLLVIDDARNETNPLCFVAD